MSFRKYFIAIVMPPDVLEQAEHLKTELNLRYALNGALRSPAHITLHRPFEWKEDRESELIARIGAFAWDEEFEVELRDFGYFEPRVIFIAVMPAPELEQLHDRFARHAQKKLGLVNETGDMRGFHPHVTIAFRDLRKPLFYKLKEEFSTRKFSASFAVKGFSLLRLEKKWEAISYFPFSAG
jgi:2'-5' RNA ligase